MTVLVTGGAGYIGSHMAWELLDHGEAVLVVDNLSTGFDWLVPSQARLVTGDIGDADLLDTLFEDGSIDAVIHFAGSIIVPESVSDPLKYYRNNTCNALALIHACIRHGVKHFIFSSTAAVYGEPEETPISEEALTRPVNSYGDSKLMFERILDWYDRAYGLRYISLRYFNAAGASEKCGEAHDPETHLIPLILEVAMGKKKEIQVYGTDYDTPDGTCIRDYIHVLDLAKAHVLALQNLDGNKPRVYNLGNDDGDSIYQVIEAARQVTGHPIPAVPAPRRSGDPARLTATSARIRSELGRVPDYPDLHAIIETAWKWHQRRA